MKKQNEGFIFLMTLCTILVISLLVLTSMQHVLLYNKAINRQEIQHQDFYQLEDLALQLARMNPNAMDKNCVENGDSVNQIIDRLMDNEGCSLNIGQSSYRYFIEDLGVFPCLVSQQGGKKRSTRHLRITLLLLGDEHYTHSVLQIRSIKLDDFFSCVGEEHEITAGISSWRYFPDYRG